MDEDDQDCDPLLRPASGVTASIVRKTPWPADKELERALIEAARAAVTNAAPQRNAGEIAILLTGDGEIRSLNRTWRGKDKPTNVLSFPIDSKQGLLGDVVLAYETVAGEARARNLPLADHASHLVVHGVLHLLGHDHLHERDALAMEALETRILRGLGLHDPYAQAPATAGAVP